MGLSQQGMDWLLSLRTWRYFKSRVAFLLDCFLFRSFAFKISASSFAIFLCPRHEFMPHQSYTNEFSGLVVFVFVSFCFCFGYLYIIEMG